MSSPSFSTAQKRVSTCDLYTSTSVLGWSPSAMDSGDIGGPGSKRTHTPMSSSQELLGPSQLPRQGSAVEREGLDIKNTEKNGLSQQLKKRQKEGRRRGGGSVRGSVLL